MRTKHFNFLFFIIIASFYLLLGSVLALSKSKGIAEFELLPGQDPARLASWKDNTGKIPESFTSDSTHWMIYSDVVLQNDLRITGQGSKVIVTGAQYNQATLILMPGSILDATVDIAMSGQINILGSHYPTFGELHEGSTVVFTLDEKNIPYHDYYNLIMVNTKPIFEPAEDPTLRIRGSLTLSGDVVFPDSTGNVAYNIMFHGPSSNGISTDGNILRCHDLIIEKNTGIVRLFPNSVLAAHNQLRFSLSGDALLQDNGATIYSGNGFHISGKPENYELSGNMILTDETMDWQESSEMSKGIVLLKLETELPEQTPPALYNLVFEYANEEGEIFLTTSHNQAFVINGDLIIERLNVKAINSFETPVIIKGRLKIDELFKGSLDNLLRE